MRYFSTLMLKRSRGDWLRYRRPLCGRCLFLAFHHQKVFLWPLQQGEKWAREQVRGTHLAWPVGGKGNVLLVWHMSIENVKRLPTVEGSRHLSHSGERGRTALKTPRMISDSNNISSLVRCPLCVHHCLDGCQDLLFRCWVSLCTQFSSFIILPSFGSGRAKESPAVLVILP